MSRIGRMPIVLPKEVKVSCDPSKVEVTGPKGHLTCPLPEGISASVDKEKMFIHREDDERKSRALQGLTRSLIANMVTGVTKGYTYKLKVVFSHFPISVNLKDKNVLIENFTGERSPRKAKIVGDVQVKIQSEDVVIQGINVEDVSQTAANIEQATRVKRKDPRIFLDGLYVYERSEGAES